MASQSPAEQFLFYSCAIVSFLESRVDTYVENLAPFFECDPGTREWLETIWLPEEQEHGRLMRRYVERRWPDFLWSDGFTMFSTLYVPRCSTPNLRPSVALEALARCVTETEATMIYRCLASYADDPELAALLKRLSKDEVRHYREFRDIHKRYEPSEGNGFLTKAKTLLARSELVRDEDLSLAFRPLNENWKNGPPFAPWGYSDYLGTAARVMKTHFPFREAKRMLFNPIKTGGLINRITIDLLAIIVARQFLSYAK